MIFKRTKITFLLAVVVVFFINCGNGSNSTPSPTTSSNTSTNADLGCTDALATNYKSSATQDDCGCQYNYSSNVSTKLPSTFSQKVMVEEFTGTWCGWCPLGRETMAKISQNKAIVGVEIHYQDDMANDPIAYSPLRTQFGSPAFPTGLVNRVKSALGTTKIMGNDEWLPTANIILSNPKSSIGIAIESKLTGTSLEVMTHLKFQNSLTDVSNYGLGIYLVEDEVTGYAQVNYLTNMSQFSQYEAYKLPSMITNVVCRNVVRATIAPNIVGIDIPSAALKDGKVYNKLFKIGLPNNIKSASNCKIMAFIMNRSTKEIMNVQEVKLGETKDWE